MTQECCMLFFLEAALYTPPYKTKDEQNILESQDKLINNVLFCTPTHGHSHVDQASKNLHSTALFKHRIPSRALSASDVGTDGKRKSKESVLLEFFDDNWSGNSTCTPQMLPKSRLYGSVKYQIWKG